MKRITDLLKKLRIATSSDEGEAIWNSQDLLGDQHRAHIAWSPTTLTVTKTVEMNGDFHNNFCASWAVSEKGRLLLKDHQGFPSYVSSSAEVFEFIRQQLESGDAPLEQSHPLTTVAKGRTL